MSLWNFAKFIVGTSSVALLSALALVYFFQRKLIYVPNYPTDRKKLFKPSDFGMAYEDVSLVSKDGIKLKGYFINGEKSDSCLIYCQANAGNIGHRLPISKSLINSLGVSVLMISYRGYGLSDGFPDEKGIKLDIEATVEYAITRCKNISFFGQSIGGAVAIHGALYCKLNNIRVQSIILENTFTSIPDLIPHVLPWLAFFKSFCHQEWNSLKVLPQIKSIPCLLLSGKVDELVPSYQMSILKDNLDKCTFVEFEHGSHNDTVMQKGYFQAIQKFFSSLE